jgi:hypothetical protein
MTVERWRPGRPASGCCRTWSSLPGMPNGLGWLGRRRDGYWTVCRPTCVSGANTGRPGRSPSRRWRSPRTPSGQTIRRSPGGVTTLAGCCRPLGTCKVPGRSMSGRLRSARRPLAPTTPTWPPTETTSAACCRTLGTWSVLGAVGAGAGDQRSSPRPRPPDRSRGPRQPRHRAWGAPGDVSRGPIVGSLVGGRVQLVIGGVACWAHGWHAARSQCQPPDRLDWPSKANHSDGQPAPAPDRILRP